MTDNRREFLHRFAVAALAAGTTGGCFADERTVTMPSGAVVYGPPPTPPRVVMEFTVFFPANSTALLPEAKRDLDRVIALMMKSPERTIVIEGHTDDRAAPEYALALGERYAKAVKDYLAANGISANRIKTVSYGKERPAANAKTEAARAMNRRAIIRTE